MSVLATRLVPAPTPPVERIPQLIDFAAERFGDSPFLLRWTEAGWHPLSFRQAARAVHAFAALLARVGVIPGAKVGLQSENRAEYGLAYLAILENGGVAVPLDAQLKAQEVGEILATAQATHCVVSRRQLGTLQEVRRDRLPSLVLVSLDDEADLPSWPEAQRSASAVTPSPAAGDPQTLALLIFTSGTTGQAKGVMLSHANLLWNIEGVARTFEFDHRDRLLSVLPLHHTFEFTVGFLLPLRVGASVAYARGLKSSELRDDLRTSRATVMLGVPLLYDKLLAAIRRAIDEAPGPRRALAKLLLGTAAALRRITGWRAGRTLGAALRRESGMASIRMFVSGAAPLPPEVFYGLMDLGWPVVEGYGLTECSPVVAGNDPDAPESGSVGRPLAGVEVRLVDPDPEGHGEITVRGPNVMLGYYRDPVATAEVLRDGWLYTGDLGCLTRRGLLRITGRRKNMIATAAGKKIYPEEVEVQLAASPYVAEVVVVGGRDARGEREEVHAHVFPDLRALEVLAQAQGKTFDDGFVEEVLRRDIDSRCQNLAAYKRVKRVVIRRSEFPKTATGKIRRQDLAVGQGTWERPAVA